MNILFVSPPHIPFYFNVCYNYTELGEVASYISNLDGVSVKVVDGSVLNVSWDRIARELAKRPDLLVILNQFENLIEVKKLCNLCKYLSPTTKILSYGQVSHLIPQHFQRYALDAIVYSGDWECEIEEYIRLLRDRWPGKLQDLKRYPGLMLREGKEWLTTGPGKILEDGGWTLPTLELLPLEDYFRIYNTELDIAGIRGKRELGLSVSKGCVFNCRFCNIPKIHGRKDRRKSATEIVDYLQDNFGRHGFDLLSIFSPAFTFNRSYVFEFCQQIEDRGLRVQWKCVTPYNCVDDELLSVMGQAGCVRIGFGVETLSHQAQRYIKKKVNEVRLAQVISSCRQNGIIPLCFLMIGIPGQTRDEWIYTVQTLRTLGAELRITAYTPFYNLSPDMSPEQIAEFNRKTISAENVEGLSKEEFYQIMFNFDGWVSSI